MAMRLLTCEDVALGVLISVVAVDAAAFGLCRVIAFVRGGVKA